MAVFGALTPWEKGPLTRALLNDKVNARLQELQDAMLQGFGVQGFNYGPSSALANGATYQTITVGPFPKTMDVVFHTQGRGGYRADATAIIAAVGHSTVVANSSGHTIIDGGLNASTGGIQNSVGYRPMVASSWVGKLQAGGTATLTLSMISSKTDALTYMQCVTDWSATPSVST
jgi:hypothetical protein